VKLDSIGLDVGTKVAFKATCADCAWTSKAEGAGAMHARSQNHTVHVQVIRTFVYNSIKPVGK
jgi:hypothetical protein